MSGRDVGRLKGYLVLGASHLCFGYSYLQDARTNVFRGVVGNEVKVRPINRHGNRLWERTRSRKYLGGGITGRAFLISPLGLKVPWSLLG